MLLAAPLAFLVSGRAARTVAILAAVIETGLVFWMLAVVAERGPLVYAVGGWGAPLGIDLRVDGLSAVMIALTAVVGSGVTVFSAGYFTDHDRYRFFWPLWLLLWGSLVALFSSGDAFNLYVCLELVSVSAIALVAISGSRMALAAAMRYLLAAIGGSLLYLLGVAMLYGASGTLDIASLAQAGVTGEAAQAGLALIVAGLVVKTALVPMHFWLPPAHANAPSPVSAVLSALVVKGSFFILLRMVFALPDAVRGLEMLLGLMGAVAIVWGSLQALSQTRLKMLVAYSTVAQIGYLFLMFPIASATGGSAAGGVAVSAGVFHALSHGLAKTAMFLSAGAVLAYVGHDRIAELRGLSRRAPYQALAFGLAGVSMMGLPPSGGFVSKWLYVSSAIDAGVWWWAIPVVVGGLLAGAYVFRVVAVFMRVPADDPDISDLPAGATVSAEEIRSDWSRAAMNGAPLALALLSLGLGAFGQPVLDIIQRAAAMLVVGVGS